jgi:hypothetical protein
MATLSIIFPLDKNEGRVHPCAAPHIQSEKSVSVAPDEEIDPGKKRKDLRHRGGV